MASATDDAHTAELRVELLGDTHMKGRTKLLRAGNFAAHPKNSDESHKTKVSDALADHGRRPHEGRIFTP